MRLNGETWLQWTWPNYRSPTIQAEPAVLAGWSSGTMSGLVQLSLLLLRIYYLLAGILWSKTLAQ